MTGHTQLVGLRSGKDWDGALKTALASCDDWDNGKTEEDPAPSIPSLSSPN